MNQLLIRSPQYGKWFRKPGSLSDDPLRYPQIITHLGKLFHVILNHPRKLIHRLICLRIKL